MSAKICHVYFIQINSVQQFLSVTLFVYHTDIVELVQRKKARYRLSAKPCPDVYLLCILYTMYIQKPGLDSIRMENVLLRHSRITDKLE